MAVLPSIEEQIQSRESAPASQAAALAQAQAEAVRQWTPRTCDWCFRPLTADDLEHGLDHGHYGLHAHCLAEATRNVADGGTREEP